MSITYRRSRVEDCSGVRAVAESLAFASLSASGIDAAALSSSGFLLYPLEADSTQAPNYHERIEASEHFWVAENQARIVGFVMAYTFDCMARLLHKTPNDLATLEHFITRMRTRGSIIYLAQAGVLPDHQRRGIYSALIRHAFDSVDGTDHPALIAEIAQFPLWNQSSTLAALETGFSPVFLRDKPGHPPTESRLSATFMKSLPCRRPLTNPIRC